MSKLLSGKSKWLLLTIGVACIFLSGPVLRIGFTGWFVPAGILYFTRASHPLKGYLWSILFVMVISVINGIFTSPFPFIVLVIAAPVGAIPGILPYLVDRLIYRKLTPVLASLLLPAVAVTFEYFLSFLFSTMGALGVTQVRFIEFSQFASITGLFGLSFLMYWSAAVIVPLIQKEKDSKLSFKIFAIVITMVMIFGITRTSMIKEVQETVKVSGITVEENAVYEALFKNFFGKSAEIDMNNYGSEEMGKVLAFLPEFLKNPNDEKFTDSQKAFSQFADKLIELTINEAKNGAKIVVWSETNLMIFKKDETKYLELLKEVAKKEKIFISASMGVLLPYEEGGPMYENTTVLATPDGKIADTFQKAKPVPFMDSSLPGDGIMEIVESPYGRLTTAICYDGDFPDLIAQSGKADILLLPSNDWLGVSPFHGDNAAFRAIENGVSIIRPTGSGQSVIFDPFGNALSRVNAFDHEVRIINAYVPINGVTTIYSLIGNTFIWLVILLGISLLGISFTRQGSYGRAKVLQ